METIGTLAGGIAHDFNNILAPIIGYTDMVLDSLPPGDPRREDLEQVFNAARRAKDLIKQILVFGRRAENRRARVQAHAVVGEAVQLARSMLPATIDVVCAIDVAAGDIIADAGQIHQIVMNLCTNAAHAMAPDGGALRIALGREQVDETRPETRRRLEPGSYVVLTVADSGHGMDAPTLARIFEPFFTTKDPGKGTGLGLSMVYGFMKQSGGHINVYSERGIGTTFRLYLPRAESGKALGDEPAATTMLEGRGETVLAVEDNLSLRRVVTRQLHELGYRVLEAENASAALAILEKERVDLLFTDVVMAGGMSGIDLADHARQQWPGIKVLITSGFPDAKFNGNGDGNGRGGPSVPARLLNKPYRKEDLARALRAALGG
jgi:CheY-like chemotaxis protein